MTLMCRSIISIDNELSHFNEINSEDFFAFMTDMFEDSDSNEDRIIIIKALIRCQQEGVYNIKYNNMLKWFTKEHIRSDCEIMNIVDELFYDDDYNDDGD